MHICPLCCRTAAGWYQGKDELKGLFQLNVSMENLQNTPGREKNAGLGHDLQEYSNEVLLS